MVFLRAAQPLAMNLERNYQHYVSLCQSRMIRESTGALAEKEQEDFEKLASRMESLSDKLRPFTSGGAPTQPARRESK